MSDKRLLRKIHYSSRKNSRAAELFKKISKVKRELDDIYESIKDIVQNQYDV